MHSLRRASLVFGVALFAVAAASCSKDATAPANGPTRDLTAVVQTDTTIYHSSLQGSGYVFAGSAKWTIPVFGNGKTSTDSSYRLQPCAPVVSSATITVERADGSASALAFKQLGCVTSLKLQFGGGMVFPVVFTLTAPATAAAADRTGMMRLRIPYELCSAQNCVTMPGVLSNTFEVRQ